MKEQIVFETARALLEYEREEGRPPTMRDLSDSLGVAPSAVYKRLLAAEDEGLVFHNAHFGFGRWTVDPVAIKDIDRYFGKRTRK